MKRVILLLLATMILGCSAPKNYYYFDYVKNSQSKTTSPNEDRVDEKTALNSFEIDPRSLTASAKATSPMAPIAESTTESTSPAHETSAASVTVQSASSKMTKREARKEIREAVKSVRKSEAVKDIKATGKEKNANKNGFAIAGFVMSVVSIFVLWPLAIPGIIFSAIGMGSDKRGLAIAGLVIGIVALVLVLAISAALVAASA